MNDLNRITSPLRLAVGTHAAGSGKGCAMNVISWENGDTTITDYPACSARFLACLVQMVNDTICTHTQDRSFLCPDCSMKVLDLGHRTVGTNVYTSEHLIAWLDELINSPTWGCSRFTAAAARAARTAAYSAARAARTAAYSAARAARAARAAEAAEEEAESARLAARAASAAEEAAWAAAEATARAVWAAEASAAWARYDHASIAFDAWHRICGTKPTVPVSSLVSAAYCKMIEV